ncbi:MAG: iron-sulfur cluster insertion protein ErpA [Candidatus Latescibacterota bacterium]
MTVTEVAAARIRHLLSEQGHPQYGLRLGVMGGGCSGFQYRLAFEERERETDQVIEDKGVRIFVDPKSCLYLSGVTLDYRDTLMGAGFRVENPNARTTCGCGESFGV